MKRVKEFINIYVISYDTIIALILSAICLYLIPEWVGGGLVKDLLGMGIGVLSIIFSIFFAALAFIMSSSDNEFVKFLEKDKIFTGIINTFKWTVGSLFVALLYSIIVYIAIAFKNELSENFVFSKYIIGLFCFLFFYSLIATILSTQDAIKYSNARIDFANKIDDFKKTSDGETKEK